MSDAEETVHRIELLAPRPARRSPRTAGLPRCPGHLGAAAAKEWRRVARLLHAMGVLTAIDRAALAAYCQAWGRWVEAERRLAETPILVRTPSGHVQQSPWLAVANKQLELMGRYMIELGMTPAARSRVTAIDMTQAGRPGSRVGAADTLRRRLDAMAGRIGGDASPEPRTIEIRLVNE